MVQQDCPVYQINIQKSIALLLLPIITTYKNEVEREITRVITKATACLGSKAADGVQNPPPPPGPERPPSQKSLRLRDNHSISAPSSVPRAPWGGSVTSFGTETAQRRQSWPCILGVLSCPSVALQPLIGHFRSPLCSHLGPPLIFCKLPGSRVEAVRCFLYFSLTLSQLTSFIQTGFRRKKLCIKLPFSLEGEKDSLHFSSKIEDISP